MSADWLTLTRPCGKPLYLRAGHVAGVVDRYEQGSTVLLMHRNMPVNESPAQVRLAVQKALDRARSDSG